MPAPLWRSAAALARSFTPRGVHGAAQRVSGAGGVAKVSVARRVFLGAGVTLCGGGVFVSLDDSRLSLGVRRSVVFWVQAFPMYLHYRWVEERTKGLPDSEVEAAYDALHDMYADKVVSLCIHLGGYFYKAAQIVSTRDEFVPPQYMRELKRLQGNAPPQRAGVEVKEMVREELGLVSIDDVFEEFDDEAFGAASVGQVHRAVLKGSGGGEVAVKVKHPRVEDYFRSDMKIIKDFCSLAMRQHLPALREIEKQFMSEFDFTREAANMARVAEMLNNHPKWGQKVRVPDPKLELCSDGVLVMEMLPGVRLEEGIRKSLSAVAAARGTTGEALEEEHRREIERKGLVAASHQDLRIRTYHLATRAADLVRNAPRFVWNATVGLVWGGARREYVWTPVMINMAAMLDLLLQVHAYEVLIGGCFNGDPHPGNILLMPDGRLGLIDYGSCVDMDMATRIKLSRLIVALAKGTPERVSQISMEDMGVVTKQMVPEIHYRSAAFWYDRDDVTNGMNVHKFLEWLHEQDPIVVLPDEFVMAGRVSVLLRGMGAAFGLKVSVAKAWVSYAEELLRSQGLSEGGVRVAA